MKKRGKMQKRRKANSHFDFDRYRILAKSKHSNSHLKFLFKRNNLLNSKCSNSHFDFVIKNNILSKSKLSQATIITTVLLILLVLVAVIIIWNVVQPLIRKTGEKVGTEAFTVSLSVEEAKLWVTGGAQVRVKRGAGEGEITSLKFVFEKADGETIVIERKEDVYEMPAELETKIYDFSVNEINEQIEKVSVVPMFEAGAGIEAKEENPEKNAVPEDPTVGLASWWKFDWNANDNVGENDGILVGDANTNGNVLNLDGDGDYVTAGPSSSLNDAALHYTVTVWSKGPQPGETWKGIVGKPGRNYHLWLNSGGYIHHRFHTTASTNEGCPDLYGIVWNDWNFVAITNDGSTCHTYIYNKNGEFHETGSVNPLVADNTALQIGRNLDSGASHFFSGQIDNIMLFNKALSAEEIKAIYNNQKK